MTNWPVDKVVRAAEVLVVESTTVRESVLLKIIVKSGGKRMRLEIPFNAYAVEEVVRALRQGVVTQSELWQQIREKVGEP